MDDDADRMRDFCEDLEAELLFLWKREETRTLGQQIIAEHEQLMDVLATHERAAN